VVLAAADLGHALGDDPTAELVHDRPVNLRVIGRPVVAPETGAQRHVGALEVEPHAGLGFAWFVAGLPGEPAADEQRLLAGRDGVVPEMASHMATTGSCASRRGSVRPVVVMMENPAT
jgi:hypothetical protein